MMSQQDIIDFLGKEKEKNPKKMFSVRDMVKAGVKGNIRMNFKKVAWWGPVDVEFGCPNKIRLNNKGFIRWKKMQE